MTNEENKSLNEVISNFQREMFDKGRFYQSEMAQYLIQLAFEKCAQWKDQEFARQKQALIDKACDAYCKVCGHFAHTVPTHICRLDCRYYIDFRKAMENK